MDAAVFVLLKQEGYTVGKSNPCKKSIITVVVVLLFNVHGKQLWSCRDGQLT